MANAIEQFTATSAYALNGEEAERDGFTFAARIEHDDMHGAPWEECDGHGPVTDWERRGKLPGELVLCDDNPSGLRGNTARRFYDFQDACRIALRDGWNAAPYAIEGETARQRAARAARADYEYLRAWCNDDWSYCGVIVTASRNGVELASASLWGIESNAGDYLRDVANELLEDALGQAREALESLCDCEEAAA